MSEFFDIIAAVLWGFNCGYAIRRHNTADFAHGVFAGLAIVGITSM